jgi:hypothetical protein
MQLADFERMVERMIADIPPQYLDGIAGIEVSGRTMAHPDRDGVYTMGECIPLDVGGGDGAPSRVVLYHGSFQALARERQGFDWRGEAWETLTHELRHHLEWKANAQDLEEYDWAADQGFARGDDDNFDPVYYLAGEKIAADVYEVDDDVFFDRQVSSVPATTEIDWQGHRFRITIPPSDLPLYVVVEGLVPAPAGDAIVVFRRAPGLLDLFRRARRPVEVTVRAEPL